MKTWSWILLVATLIIGGYWLMPHKAITEPPIQPARVPDYGDVRLRSLGGMTVDQYCDSLANAWIGSPRQP